jgi:hypothetical protein
MNLRKYKVLVVGGAIAAVLLAVALVFLIRYQRSYSAVNSRLTAAVGKLDQLNRKEPFPAQSNVERAQKNKEMVQEYLSELKTRILENQVEAEDIEPAQFAPLLENLSRKVFARAEEAGVKVPEETALAFKRYMEGKLPSRQDIPRLVVQLRTIEALLNLLFDAGIGEVLAIERDIFESEQEERTTGEGNRLLRRGADTAPRGGMAQAARRVPRPPAGDLYDVERIYIEFLARENAAWDVLNALARCKTFAVVADVAMENSATGARVTPGSKMGMADYGGLPPGLKLPAPGVAAAKPHDLPGGIIPPREDRVVAGRESVQVKLVLDVYRFKKDGAKEEER